MTQAEFNNYSIGYSIRNREKHQSNLKLTLINSYYTGYYSQPRSNYDTIDFIYNKITSPPKKVSKEDLKQSTLELRAAFEKFFKEDNKCL